MRRLILLLALCNYPVLPVLASAESVDRMTQSALELDAHPERGAEQFQQSCTRCHGRHAQGDPERAIPALAGQRFRYLVRQLANFAGGERDSTVMQRVVAHKSLGRAQTWVDVAAYLNNLPVTTEKSTGPGQHAALGRGIFHEQCASCHKADARGDDDGFVPSLRNQNYPYLLRQLQILPEGSRHNVDENLVRFWGSLSAEDVEGTADYLSRLRGPGHVHKEMRSDGAVVD